ncbi:acetate--CoA ligase family protein [Solimonas variicoloris]|uniref:acetate--CoA ligase family protein n=1 Tax=Solimonas variicoloris TaxID=254408 RepID=UPI00037744AC|nr:acetate--CoA ligase family protein [Solimonas variicoloris]
MPADALDAFFRPASVALIGASTRPGSVGALAARNLLDGGYAGPVMFVNPRHTEIGGRPVYADVASLPQTPALAVIATPPATVPGLIAALGARGTRAIVVITAGFGELGEQGKALQRAAVAAARAHGARLIGPNCLGLQAPAIGLNASFAQLLPPPGRLAFVSQSGAMATALLDWAAPRGIGFSQLVSLGDMADVDFADLLRYLADEPGTEAILLYIEGLREARGFIEAARAAVLNKPVIALKAGRRAESAKAAASHTGALAGADAAYEAAFRRAGILRVRDTLDLFDAAQTLACTGAQRGERLAILTNGGGPGVLASDALADAGGRLATLAPQTLARLDATLPPTWSHGNPVDIIGDASSARYREALAALLDDADVDAVLVINCPTAVGHPLQAAQAVAEVVTQAQPQRDDRNVLGCWLGRHSAEAARRVLVEAGIAGYETPEEAVRGFMQRVQYGRCRDAVQAPVVARPYTDVDTSAAGRAIDGALGAAREWLDSEEVDRLLGAWRIAVPALRVAADVDAAVAAAAAIGYPVALKIRSAQITHKTDVGGVALGLADADALRREAAAMLERVRAARPDAQLAGFTVQAMVRRPQAFELIVGVTRDPSFGPLLMFGHGGIAVEVQQDSAIELLPLDAALARAQIARTRIYKQLQGLRRQPPADLDGIVDMLLRVAAMVTAHPQIGELDINPLLADARGVLALDARVRVAAQPD